MLRSEYAAQVAMTTGVSELQKRRYIPKSTPKSKPGLIRKLFSIFGL